MFNINNKIKHAVGRELSGGKLRQLFLSMISLVSGKEGISKGIEYFNILLGLVMRIILGTITFLAKG